MFTRKTLLFFLLVFLCLFSYGQDTINPAIYFQAGGYSGFLYAHHRSMGYYIQDYPSGGELKLGWKFNGSSPWQHAMRFPEAGVGILWGDFGNKSVLGNGYSLYGFLDIPIYERQKFVWSYQLAAGIGYVTKIFDIQNNYNNEAIGSHYNAFLLISTGLKYKVTPRISLTLDCGLHHFSNGNAKEPNQGLNTFYTMIGGRYFFNQAPLLKYPNIVKPVPTWETVFFAATGVKEERPVDNQKYSIFDTHVTFRRKFSHVNSWGFGVNLMYDGSIEKQLKIRQGHGYVVPDSIYNPSEWQNFTPAIHGSWSTYVGKIVFSIQVGVYIYNALNRIIFNRWLLEIDIYDNLSISGGLKSHFGSADYIEVGMAWKIRR